jgi:hypothetical protein
MNKKIKFLINLFIIIASLYLWYIFITYTTFIDVFIALLTKDTWFFISSIITVILLIFIDRKSSMKGKK